MRIIAIILGCAFLSGVVGSRIPLTTGDYVAVAAWIVIVAAVVGLTKKRRR